MVEPGRRRLGDRYELHQLIAAGGMGQVWRATDIAFSRPVAVKVLRSEYTGDPTFLARFRAEAQHAASLSHPNIAVVFDYGEEIAQDGTGETLAYLVMELVEGEPLSRLLARDGRLDTTTTLSVVRQVATALGEAHRAGLVHRDVKPGNILVRPDGSVKITDFGIAWSARSVALTRTGQVIGTPQYLSPEQAEGRLATPASDVYALGLIGYECLTGHPAFDGDNAVTIALKQVQQDPEPLPDEVPADVRGLIGRTLAKDPAARLPDGCAVAAVIDDIAAGRPVALAGSDGASTRAVSGVVPPPRSVDPATQVSGPGARRPPAGRRRGRAAMVLVPLVALMVGAAIATALFQVISDGRPRATAEAADTAHDRGVVLVAANYVNRPVDEVVAQLRSYGLDVKRQVDPSAKVAPGLVSRLDPVGVELVKGDVVTVYFAPSRSNGSGGTFAGSREVSTSGGSSAAAVTGAAQTTGAGVTAGDAGTTTAAGQSDGSASSSSSAATQTTQPTETSSSSPAASSSAPDTSASSSPATDSAPATG